MGNLKHGWYSAIKARYVGGEVYRSKSIVRGSRVLFPAETSIVTDVVDGTAKHREHGDEVYVGVIDPSDFVRSFGPDAATEEKS